MPAFILCTGLEAMNKIDWKPRPQGVCSPAEMEPQSKQRIPPPEPEASLPPKCSPAL